MAIEYQYPQEEKELIELGESYRITPTNFLYQPLGVYYQNYQPEDKFYWGGTGLLLEPRLTLDLSESALTYPSGQTVYTYIWRYIDKGYRLSHSSASPTSSMFINWDNGIQNSHACQQLIYGGGNQWQYPIVGEPDYSQIGNRNSFFRTKKGSLTQSRQYEAFGEFIIETLPFYTVLYPGYFYQVTTERTFYKFEVFSNQNIIFTRTELEQPEVRFVGVCPPNTCPVDCGTHICCYGSDGIVVSSFSK